VCPPVARHRSDVASRASLLASAPFGDDMAWPS